MHSTIGRIERAHALNTPAGAGEPRPPADRPPTAVSRSAADALSLLAHLIDREITWRGVGIRTRDFAARILGCAPSALVTFAHETSGIRAQLVALALGDLLLRTPPIELIGYDAEEPPEYARVRIGDHTNMVPWHLAAAFAPGALADCPLVVGVAPGDGRWTVTVYARVADSDAAQQTLDDIVEAPRSQANPLRMRVLSAKYDRYQGLWFDEVPVPTTRRSDLVFADSIWATLDLHVHGLFACHERLHIAGLSANRGVLLAGPPGTGKTAICRALAAEVAGSVTVVFCETSVLHGGVSSLYEELATFGPSLVVMEDVDLAIGHRANGATGALLDFLVALDGAMSSHQGVVTVASTNDVEAIDPAARRSARFDCVLDVPLPARPARIELLRRSLARVVDVEVASVDLHVVAGAAAGSSGAALRDVVTEAVIRAVANDAPIDTDLLLRVLAARRAPSLPGQYL